MWRGLVPHANYRRRFVRGNLMDTEEAVRRVRLITPMLRNDVKTAILSHAVMESANGTIPKGVAGLQIASADTYHAVQSALTIKVAMDLARIFDRSENRPLENQDKASVPILAALLGRSDVQTVLVREAANWIGEAAHVHHPSSAPADLLDAALRSLEEQHRSEERVSCRKAIDEFLTIAARLTIDGSKEKVAFERIRELRHRRLAHSLFDKQPEALPKYSDLQILLDVAKEAAERASLAVERLNTDFADLAQHDRENADGYYACVLDGLQRKASQLSGQEH
jgi:hypothetical protein